MPTGAGEPRPLTNDALTHGIASFTADGRDVVFRGAEPNKAERAWIQPLAGGPARPITPEGVVPAPGNPVSPDGASLIVRTADARWAIAPIAGGPLAAIKGLSPDGGRHRVHRRQPRGMGPGPAPGRGRRAGVPFGSGDRRPYGHSARLRRPPRSLGMGGVGQILMTPDGRGYVYSYGMNASDLVIVKGLR